MKKILFILFFVVLFQSVLPGASAGITPASHRQNKTVECIGNELNAVLFYLTAQNFLPNTFASLSGKEELTLEIDWPADIKMTGWVNAHQQNGAFFKPVFVRKKGKYNVLQIKISQDTVQKRLKRHYVHIFVYFRMPAQAEKTFSWKVISSGKILAKETNKLKTVGVIDRNAKLAKTYRAYICQPGADSIYMPARLMDERINYYKRLGLDTLETIYGTARRTSEKNSRKMLSAGLEVAGLRLGGLYDLQKKYYTEKNFGAAGLVGSMKKFCDEIRQREDIYYKNFCAPHTNAFAIDWEPSMIRQNSSGYDDAATVTAFAQKFNIKEKLTPQILKSKYAKQYASFRQELYCMPIKTIRDMVKKYKPRAAFYVCHGSGLPWKDLDYQVYDKYADFHLPMIYTGSTMSFFNSVEDMSTYVNKKKLMPITELAYSGAVNYSDVNACVMNLLSPALAGCAGVGQWPGLTELDGGIHYAFYRTKVLLAPVIDIFQQGKSAKIGIKPLPFQKKIIRTGDSEIDLSYPQWSSSAIIRAKEFRNRCAIGILNLNARETLFTELTLPDGKAPRYLIEPDKKQYMRLSGKAQKVILKTAPHSPGIWLLTQDTAECAGMKQITSAKFAEEFANEQRKNASRSGNTVSLGKKGSFDISYMTQNKLPLLTIKTQDECIGFSTSGGRIMHWSKGNSGNLISSSIPQGGFAMDMFWLPRSGRWSGDEVADMTLESCTNDGNTVKITYSGSLNRTLNGCTLTKVYTLKKDKPGIRVNVMLRNGNPDPRNTFSHWSHNFLAQDSKLTEYAVFTQDGRKADTSQPTSCYPNAVLTSAEKTLLGVPKHQREAVRSTFGIYDKAAGTGFIFTYPENFLMNYRFGSCADVMMKPVTLPHNGILKINYHIQAEQIKFNKFSARVKTLSEQTNRLSENEESSDSSNLLSTLLRQKRCFVPRTLKNNAAWHIENDVLHIDMPQENSVIDLRSKGVEIKPGKKYLLSMQVKIEKLLFRNAKSFFIVYMYNQSNNKHSFLRFSGSGSSSGYLTVQLPFESDRILGGKLESRPIVMLKLENLSGKFAFRNFTLIELPQNADLKRGVISSDGKMHTGSGFRVR